MHEIQVCAPYIHTYIQKYLSPWKMPKFYKFGQTMK